MNNSKSCSIYCRFLLCTLDCYSEKINENALIKHKSSAIIHRNVYGVLPHKAEGRRIVITLINNPKKNIFAMNYIVIQHVCVCFCRLMKNVHCQIVCNKKHECTMSH